MLRIYAVVLELIRSLVTLIGQIERHDADLARQMRRALSSISLNIAEGSYSRGRNRNVRYHTAVGSAREALACLETAAAFGYIARVDPTIRQGFDHTIGTLMRLVRR
jgi:four helix bundle protein